MSLVLPTFSGFAQPASGGGGSFVNALAGSFDGTDAYLDLGTSSAYSIISGGSISYWIYPSFTTSQYTESVGKRSTAGWQITHTLTGGNMAIQPLNHTFDGGNCRVDVSVANQWYLITLVFHASGGATLYLNDGASGASGTGETSSKPSYSFTEDASAPLYIARHPTVLSRCFTGNVDEFAIFNSELSASDVTAIYNSGVPADLSSLSPVGWYRLGDGTGDTDSGGGAPASGDTIGTVVNQGSGGNNATATNGPTYSSTVPS